MRNKVLPIIAIILVIIAFAVTILIPKNKNSNQNEEKSNKTSQATSNVQRTTTNSAKLATLDEDGNVIINSDDVSEDKVSFIKYSEDSKLEIIAVKGKDGNINVALDTCQSCNGSPKAYYTQSGEELKCNNCGLTFPLDVIGVDGTGCHPIMIDESGITTTENGITINKDILLSNEKLFANISTY